MDYKFGYSVGMLMTIYFRKLFPKKFFRICEEILRIRRNPIPSVDRFPRVRYRINELTISCHKTLPGGLVFYTVGSLMDKSAGAGVFIHESIPLGKYSSFLLTDVM